MVLLSTDLQRAFRFQYYLLLLYREYLYVHYCIFVGESLDQIVKLNNPPTLPTSIPQAPQTAHHSHIVAYEKGEMNMGI